MEPAVVFLTNVSDLIQWIKRWNAKSLSILFNQPELLLTSQHSRASSCAHKEWNLTASFTLKNQSLQFAGNHASMLVRWHHHTVLSAQTADRRTRFNRVVTLVGREHAQITGKSTWSMFFVAWEHLVTCSKESVKIRDRTAWSEDRVAAWIADDFTHLRENDCLHQDENWSNLIGEHVRVGGGSKPFASHRDGVQAARELIEEVRMTWEGSRTERESNSIRKTFLHRL